MRIIPNLVAGCGNGKYLNVNTSIFNMGGDKSIRLTEVAREKENEVSVLSPFYTPESPRILSKLIEKYLLLSYLNPKFSDQKHLQETIENQ